MVDLIISVIVIGPDGFHQRQALLSSSWLVWRPQCCRSSCGPGVPAGLPLDDAVGTPIFQYRKTMSWAITTSWAFLFLHQRWWQCWPLLEGQVASWWAVCWQFSSPLGATTSALSLSFISGLYLWVSLSRWVAVCGSKAWLNWLIAGGTFSCL